MLKYKAKDRMTIEEVIDHPVFKNKKKKKNKAKKEKNPKEE